MCANIGNKEKVNTFLKLYITPGDGHGSCNWHGPGITESDGFTALMKWVEEDVDTKDIRVVLVDKSGNTLTEKIQTQY